jgi:hypothetical protein
MPISAHRMSITALGVIALVSMSGPLAASEASPPPKPILGTPEQDESEQLVLELLQHPDVKAIQASLNEQLRATEIGRTKGGTRPPIGWADVRVVVVSGKSVSGEKWRVADAKSKTELVHNAWSDRSERLAPGLEACLADLWVHLRREALRWPAHGSGCLVQRGEQACAKPGEHSSAKRGGFDEIRPLDRQREHVGKVLRHPVVGAHPAVDPQSLPRRAIAGVGHGKVMRLQRHGFQCGAGDVRAGGGESHA